MRNQPLAGLSRDGPGDPRVGAFAQSLHHSGQRVLIRPWVCVWRAGFFVCGSRNGSQGTSRFGQHSWRIENEYRGYHWATSWRAAGPDPGNELHIRSQNGLDVFSYWFSQSSLWKPRRPQKRKSIAPEHFFPTITAAVRYVIYTPGMKVILTRLGLFSFFISIIPSLMPVVGLKELHLDASQLGYLFTAMAVGSVVGLVFLVPLARARFSPNKSHLLCIFLAGVGPFSNGSCPSPIRLFAGAALGGAGWTLAASELYIAGQRAMPEWARGRMSATTVMVSQAATAPGGVIWGSAAVTAARKPPHLPYGRCSGDLGHRPQPQVVLRKRFSVDFTATLNLEPAAVTIFSHQWDPIRLSYAKENPVSVVTEFTFDSANHNECLELLREVRLIYLRNGARNWHLYEDKAHVRSNRFQMEVTAPSWIEY